MSPEFFVVSVAVIIFVGIAKSGFIGGGIVLAVPTMSLFIPPATAAGIILPLLVAMDLINMRHYRHDFSKKSFLMLMPGAIIGILLGYLLFDKLTPDILRLIIGIVAIGFVLSWLTTTKNPKPLSNFVGTILSVIGGFTSFVAHAGAPPIDAFLLRQNLTKTVIVATSVYMFTAINAIKVFAYAHLGLLNYDNLFLSLMLAPCVPVGVWLGHYLHKKISQDVFQKVAYSFLVVAGTKLSYDGISHLVHSWF